MLSRVADALYWMGRYIERAEHTARVLEAMRGLKLDLREVDREVADEQWRGARKGWSLPELSLSRLVLDPSEPTSLLCSMSRARENARQVREVISPEMWEKLNQSYWMLRDSVAAGQNEGTLSQALTGIVASSFLWDGVTDASMIRGEGWLFLKLGKFVERTDGVARLVAARLASGGSPAASSVQSGENVTWPTLLKSLDAVDAYRTAHPKRVDRQAVIAFLLFEADFPRSVRFSTESAADLARRLRRLHPELGQSVERCFGRIAARVEYAEIDGGDVAGLTPFLLELGAGVSEASSVLQKTFFLC
jgi:uncharacterized alpha-E superfamily protein